MLAVYARVSTQEQAEKGTSIDTQIAGCIEKARALGYTKWRVFVDQGESAAGLDRPALGQLRAAVAAGAVKAVIVYDPDRLARRLAHQLLLAEELQKSGVALLFVRSEHSPTPEGTMLFQIQGVIAEYEREKIRERTSRGRLAASKQGRVLPMGAAPYGYDYDARAGTLRVNPVEAEVVKQVYRWYTLEGLSMRAIGERLAARGVAARKGGRWHVSSVRRLLRSEVYIGRFYYNKRRTRFGEGRTAGGKQKRRSSAREREEWVLIEVPAIIDHDLFARAQERCRRNKSRGGPRTGREWLLKGLLVCGHCGHRWQAHARGERQEYRCANRYPRSFPGEACPTLSLPAPELDRLVWERFAGFLVSGLFHSGIFTSGKKRLVEKLETELARLEGARRRLEKERERLTWLFQQGLLPDSRIRESLQQVNLRLEKLAAEKTALETGKARLAGLSGQDAAAWLLKPDTPAAEKARLVRLFCLQAVVRFTGSRVLVELSGPIGDLREICSQHQEV